MAHIGVAILRYRLYDVDLVISRAFTGAVLTVVLALVYVGSVLVIGTFTGRGSPWATAVSTLLAAAAFKVLYQRVQRRVDSRFRPAPRCLGPGRGVPRGAAPSRSSQSRSSRCSVPRSVIPR